MKKKILFFIILASLTSCKSTLFNLALEKIGIYDDSIKLSKISMDKKDIIFFPMHHVGTESFYSDVKNKIDSLKEKNFYFFFELVKVTEDDTILRKFRKIRGLAYNQNGYTDNIDSLFKKKFKSKKDIVSQPTYKKLGLDSINSKNTDVSIEEIISFYESKYGEIQLEDCDYKTSLFQESICNDKKMSKEIREEIMIDFRNQNIVKELKHIKKNKIAIIYGKNHIVGLKEVLLKQGFKEIL